MEKILFDRFQNNNIGNASFNCTFVSAQIFLWQRAANSDNPEKEDGTGW